MANEKQLKILRQGVEKWNMWKKWNTDVEVDLSEADLSGVNLLGVTLNGANLYKAKMIGANLNVANLSGATLSGATLYKADLSLANLCRATLSGATLRGATLREATLKETNLHASDLSEATLHKANLREADLSSASLHKADLREADLSGATLHKADMHETDLRGVSLLGANLSGVNLKEAIMIRTNMSNATLTGVFLYGTARDDWIIEGVRCDFMYWDAKPVFWPREIWEDSKDEERQREEKQWEGEHRVPKDRDFRPGEFEELYKQLPTFEYYFEQGFTLLDPLIMDQVVQAINEQRPETELRLKNFEATGTPHATLTVLHKDDIEETRQQLKHDYEKRIAALEGKREQLMEVISMLTKQPQYAINIKEFIMGNQTKKIAGRDFFEHDADSHETSAASQQETNYERPASLPESYRGIDE